MAKRARSRKYGRKTIKRRNLRGRGRVGGSGYRRLLSRAVPSGMPTQKVAKLRYSENVLITSSTGILTETLFRANSIFDPNQSGAGHQPMGHDQWAALFNHYVVLGSKIRVSVVNNDTTKEPANVGVYLSDGKTLSYTQANEYIEARKGQYRTIDPSNTRTIIINNKFSAKRFFNVKDVKDNIDRLGGTMGSNPGDDAYYHVWYQVMTGNSDSIRLQIVIDYIVLFSEPKELGQS